jgi:hypothetical protein
MPKVAKFGGLLLLFWVVPFGLHALGADWVLPLVLWLGLAGLLRAGETLLDRLILSVYLGLGFLMIIGVALSKSPLGLRPAPIAALGLTALVAAFAITRRRFRLPRPRWSDAAPLGVATAITLAVAAPYLRARDFAGRLAALMSGEDPSRHASLVDQIRITGAYPFIHPHVRSDVLNPGMTDYPQGWHFAAALTENYLRSTTELGPARSGMTWLMWLILGTFGLLALTVAWGAGLLVRPSGAVTYVSVVCIAGWLTANSELVRTAVNGYPAEMMGLGFLAVLAVVAARPAVKVRDHIALLSMLTIGVGFAYYLLLPVAAVITLCAAVADRRRMRRVPFSVAAGVLLCGLAAMPAAVGVLIARQDRNIFLSRLGAVHQVDLLVLAAVVLGGLVVGRHIRVWRRFAPAVITVLLATAAMNAYPRMMGREPAYYYGKMLHVCALILIIGVGAVGVLVHPLLARMSRPVRVLAVVLVLGVLAAGQVVYGRPSLTAVPWFTKQASGQYRVIARARTIDTVMTACPPRDTERTVVFYGNARTTFGYYESIFLTAAQRTAGLTYRQVYGLPRDSPEHRAQAIIERTSGPVRLVVGDDRGRQAITRVLRAHPEWAGRVGIVSLAQIMRSGSCATAG